MSFSSLPPELVHQIIETTVPHTFHSETYKERQQTLCSLCLVSKLFHSIARPLLFEIVALIDLRDAGKLPTTRASGGALTCGAIRSLIIKWEGVNNVERTKEEKDQFAESLRVFRTVRDLTVRNISRGNFENLLSIAAHHLTSLHVTGCKWKELSRTHLPNLRDLTLFSVSSEIFDRLVDPATVPNLRNFALVDRGEVSMEELRRSKLDQFLPHLETLNVPAIIWLHPQATFLHSAASRTLVNFNSDDAERLDYSTACLKHVRIRHSSLRSFAFSHDELNTHLDRWLTYILNNPSLSLKSIYLDSTLRSPNAIPSATKRCLKKLTRVCQERNIDLVFESEPCFYAIDPSISTQFVRRQKEQRRKEKEGR